MDRGTEGIHTCFRSLWKQWRCQLSLIMKICDIRCRICGGNAVEVGVETVSLGGKNWSGCTRWRSRSSCWAHDLWAGFVQPYGETMNRSVDRRRLRFIPWRKWTRLANKPERLRWRVASENDEELQILHILRLSRQALETSECASDEQLTVRVTRKYASCAYGEMLLSSCTQSSNPQATSNTTQAMTEISTKSKWIDKHKHRRSRTRCLTAAKSVSEPQWPWAFGWRSFGHALANACLWDVVLVWLDSGFTQRFSLCSIVLEFHPRPACPFSALWMLLYNVVSFRHGVTWSETSWCVGTIMGRLTESISSSSGERFTNSVNLGHVQSSVVPLAQPSAHVRSCVRACLRSTLSIAWTRTLCKLQRVQTHSAQNATCRSVRLRCILCCRALPAPPSLTCESASIVSILFSWCALMESPICGPCTTKCFTWAKAWALRRSLRGCIAWNWICFQNYRKFRCPSKASTSRNWAAVIHPKLLSQSLCDMLRSCHTVGRLGVHPGCVHRGSLLAALPIFSLSSSANASATAASSSQGNVGSCYLQMPPTCSCYHPSRSLLWQSWNCTGRTLLRHLWGSSYSARVPRSSAEVHREFVHHILEDEDDGQKERQGDQREDGEEEEVNGDVEERAIRNNDHNTHATWDRDVMGWVRTQPWAMRVLYFTLEKWTCEVWCSHTHRRLQQTTVSCKRSNCNKPQKNLKVDTSEVLVRRRHSQRVSTFYHVALHMSSIVDFLVHCHEVHLEPLHCHQVLEEELDDGCHCWYFQNGIGLSCRSPDSWWTRLNMVNASLKSERSLTGPIFPDLLREIHHFFLSREYSSCVIR